jgi:hypothetical protein
MEVSVAAGKVLIRRLRLAALLEASPIAALQVQPVQIFIASGQGIKPVNQFRRLSLKIWNS